MNRLTIHFSGRVQGVGFRATTVRIADNYDVSGYVRNLPDGRVLLVIEGRPMQLRGMLNHVLTQMDRFIDDHTCDESEATGEFEQRGEPRFGIRY